MIANTIEDVGADIASQMLTALTEIPAPPTGDEPKRSLEEQKHYIKRYIDAIDVEGRKAIGGILVMNNKRALLCPCAEGTIINLDALPCHIIDQMYNLLQYKMQAGQKA